jgi:hypothetical protein
MWGKYGVQDSLSDPCSRTAPQVGRGEVEVEDEDVDFDNEGVAKKTL